MLYRLLGVDKLAAIVIAGYIVRYPMAGSVWHYLSYLRGFKNLGHDVYFLEEAGWEDSCYDPETDQRGNDCRYGMRYLDALLTSIGSSKSWVYRDHDGRYHGMTQKETEALLERADLVINCGGCCWLPAFAACPRLAYLDEDPGFIQFQAASGETEAIEMLEKHNLHYTFARNIGKPGCRIPAGGYDWKTTTCPVILEYWTPHVDPGPETFTTIMSWKSYGGVTAYNGEEFGQKDVEFMRFKKLPRYVRYPIEVAIGGHGHCPRAQLERLGWRMSDPLAITKDMEGFRRYIHRSRGEFSVAKNCYVKSWSGWFSQRSILYMASGKPALLQDTGFSEWLPTGEGVVAFRTFDEILAGFEAINTRYLDHCHTARQLARDYFDSKAVLTDMLIRADIEPVVRRRRPARASLLGRGG